MNTPSTTSASISDVLTAVQNIVKGINNETQTTLNIAGIANAVAISAPTVVKASAGRICSVSVIIPGSTTGLIYDSAVTGVTTKPIYVIPSAVGTEPYVVNFPCSFGILVTVGVGMTVSVSYS